MKTPASITQFVAYTHLVSRLRQNFIASLGVSFAIATYIFMMSMMYGFNDFFKNVMIEKSPHIHIHDEIETDRVMIAEEKWPERFVVVHNPRPENDPVRLKNGFQLLAQVRKHPQTSVASPSVSTQVFFTYGPVEISGMINGVDIAAEARLLKLRENLRGGDLADLLAVPNGLVVGTGLAKKLDVGVGDKVRCVSPRNVEQVFKVVALLRTGVIQIDDTRCYATIPMVQKLLRENNSYLTDINVKLKNFERAPEVAAQWERQFGYQAVSWQESNEDIEVNERLNDFVMYFTVGIFLLVVGFGIYNIFSMLIREKLSEIAILKAVGLSGGDILRIFLAEALVLGFLGGLIGLLLGYGLCRATELIDFEMDTIVSLDHFPMKYSAMYYVYGMLFALATTGLGAWIPARKAAHIDPIAIIRGK